MSESTDGTHPRVLVAKLVAPGEDTPTWWVATQALLMSVLLVRGALDIFDRRLGWSPALRPLAYPWAGLLVVILAFVWRRAWILLRSRRRTT
jgi:hypothetical protein